MEKNITILLDLFYYMLDVIIINRMLQCMLEHKDRKYNKEIYMGVLYGIFLLNYILLQIPALDTTIITTIAFVIFYMGIFFLTQIFFEGNIGEKIFTTFAYIVLAAITELVIIIATTLIFQISQIEIMENNSIYLRVMGINKILQLIEVEIIRRIKNKGKGTIQVKFTFEIASILVIYLLILIVTVAINRWYSFFVKNIHSYILIVLVLFLSITVVIMIIILRLLKRRKIELELKQRIREIELEKEYNRKIEEMECHLRSLRHDMNNHMNIIKGLLYLEEYEELKKYFSEMNYDLEKANQIVILENKAFAVLLSEKVKKAEEIGIVLELEISKENSEVSPVELCSLVSNLLDNAIEAVQKLEENRYIRFSFHVDVMKKTTEIVCENPYEKTPVEKNGIFFTIKENKRNHGIGLQNIKKIVEKNSGILQISYNTNFCVYISLPHQINIEESSFMKQNGNTDQCLYEYSEGR